MNINIYLKDVMRTVQLASGTRKTFAITYRKIDGVYGEKFEVRNRSGFYNKQKSDLSSITTENRQAGRAYMEYRTSSGWQPFEVYWCLMISFEGRQIDHRF